MSDASGKAAPEPAVSDNAAKNRAEFLQQRVVLDTQGPLMFIGELDQIAADGYWLSAVDVHDRGDGHATKEMYLAEAAEMYASGARRINRRRIFVDRTAVVAVSLLVDVVAEDDNVGDLSRGATELRSCAFDAGRDDSGTP